MSTRPALTLHVAAAFRKHIDYNECLLVPHEDELATEFIRRIATRLQCLDDGYQTEALFSEPPHDQVAWLGVAEWRVGDSHRSREEGRIQMNALMPWMGQQMKGRVGQIVAQLMGTMKGFYKSFGSSHHVK